MSLLLITQSYNRCAITNRFLTKSLKIMNKVAILDLKTSTNVINKYLDYEYASWYFQNVFLSTLFKIMKHLYFQFWPYWIANCGLHVLNPGWVMIAVKLAYQNYPLSFYH